MNTKVLLWMFTLTLALLVHGKEIKKRQIYTNSWSSNTGCNSGRCPLTSAMTSCFPGTPGCGLNGLSGFSGVSGIPLLSGYSGLSNLQSYSGYNGQSSFVSPYIGQTPLIINQPTPCAQGSTGCRVVQVPSPPQFIASPPQIQARLVPYSVPQVVPRVEVIKELVPQPYPVQQIVHVPVNRPVIVPKEITQVVQRPVEIIRDRPYDVVVRKPYEIKQKIFVQVPQEIVISSNSTRKPERVVDNTTTNKKNEKIDSTLKTDSHGFVNVTISVNNTNINDVRERTDMKHEENKSNQVSEKQKESSDNNCCTVVGPNRCDRRSHCRRTRYQRCGSFCRNSKIIFLKPRVEPIYVPQPVPVPQPYPVPVPQPQPMPGSRCYGVNAYPYLDCRGSCSSCGISGGSCSSSCYTDNYSDDYTDYEDLENYCETYGGPMC